MHMSKNHVPPGVGTRLRFQSTAQMAMHEVGSRYSEMPSMAERSQKLRERKIGNTKASIHFGSDGSSYSTTAKSNDDYDRSVVMVMAGGDGGVGMTPAEMKKKLTSSNFEVGEVRKRWKDRRVAGSAGGQG